MCAELHNNNLCRRYKKIVIIFVDSSIPTPLPVPIYQKEDKNIAICLPPPKTGPPPKKSCVIFASHCIIWKCEEEMSCLKPLPNVALSTGGFVCLRFKGMSPHVIFVVGFLLLFCPNCTKKMVLCQKGFEVDEAQATLEQQISEKTGILIVFG